MRKLDKSDLEMARDACPKVLQWIDRERSSTMGTPVGNGLYLVATVSSGVRSPLKQRRHRIRLNLEVMAVTRRLGPAPRAYTATRYNWTPADLEATIARAIAGVSQYVGLIGVAEEAMNRAYAALPEEVADLLPRDYYQDRSGSVQRRIEYALMVEKDNDDFCRWIDAKIEESKSG